MRAGEGVRDAGWGRDARGGKVGGQVGGAASERMMERGVGERGRRQQRGARGAEKNTGDGAGILLQVREGFYRQVVPFELPEPGRYATGIAFPPSHPETPDRAAAAADETATQEGLDVHGSQALAVDAPLSRTAALAIAGAGG